MDDKKKVKRIFPIVSPEGQGTGMIITDPQGSYTGRAIDVWETPVQDADDL